MPKYGKGLGKEIFLAAKKGEIKEPFTVNDCKKYVSKRGWNVPDNYINVLLSNSEKNRTHSETYKSYFIRVAEGRYKNNHSILV